MKCAAWPRLPQAPQVASRLVSSQQFITDQPLSEADVIRAMHELVQLCQDTQTEFALLNHILRVHNPGGPQCSVGLR